MCGIAGVASRATDPRLEELSRRMIATLAHRGPDGEASASFGRCALSHRRLAVIDVEGGAQPMRSPRGTAVVFNGEIYNFLELRRELAGGYAFQTRSDTEVLLAAYERWGDGFCARLRGMFAFALWDETKQELLLARDRFGKKPLFYEERDGRLAFASELKALRRAGLAQGEPDRVAALEYLAIGYVPGERTMIRGVRRLPPGHVLRFGANGTKLTKYWELPPPRARADRSDAEWVSRVGSILDESVNLRLIADVPLGAFLSGGLDSSTVVALCMKHRGRPFHTFSIRAAGGDPADADAALRVAKALGTEHHEQVVDCPPPEEAAALFEHFDEPFADSSMFPTAAVSKLARERVTVSLSGDGGDELFGGYFRYALARRARWFGKLPGFRALAQRVPKGIRGSDYLRRLAGASQGYFSVLEIFQAAERRELLQAGANDEAEAEHELSQLFETDGSVAQMCAADVRGYLPGDILPKVDLASMRASLEVRCPFLDHVLAEELAGLPDHLRMRGTLGKILLRRIARDLLPEEILTRPKLGFSVPIERWLSGSWRGLVEATFAAPGNPLVDPKLLKRHAAPPRLPHEGQLQFTLLSLAAWKA